MAANGGVMPDDELMCVIVDAYRLESLTVSLDEITSRRATAPRRVRRFALVGVVTAAALAVAAVIAIGTAVLGGFGGPGGGGVEPADSSSADPGFKPPAPTTTATDDGQRCADIAAQQGTPISLPPQRFALTGPDPLRLRLYGEGEFMVV